MKFKRGTPDHFACPYCFRWFPIDHLRFRGATGEVPGARPLLRRVLRRPPVPPDRRQPWDAVCPGDATGPCGKVLPLTTGSEQSLVIGLVGAQASGKTNYMGALIKQLSEDAGRRFHAGLLPLDSTTAQRYAKEFEIGMFRDHVPPKGTNQTPPPLMYNLTLDGELWGEDEPRSVTLALYDTAGENFEDEVKVRQLVGYLRIAAGVIFIVDPLQSSGVRELLQRSNVVLPDPKPLGRPEAMISQVINAMQQHALLEGKRRFPTPVAFTMTKCDELVRAGIIDPRSLWSSAEIHQHHFNSSLHDSLESQFREVFSQYEPAAYQNVRTRFENHAFFGVSATGHSPDRQSGRYPAVTPWRVEEPLLWLLARLGVIPEKRGSNL